MKSVRKPCALPPKYTHSHPKPIHVRDMYLKHLRGCHKSWGTARSLVHYRELVLEYAAARALVRLNRLKVTGWSGAED